MTRLHVSLKRDSAMSVTSVAIGSNKLVYVLVCDKKLKYPQGKSRIAYIGTTKNGLSRIASSVAWRANEILAIHGVRGFCARIITCQPRQRVKTWRKMERALLLKFREMFGEPPHCNTQGKNMRETDEFNKYFTPDRIQKIIEELS